MVLIDQFMLANPQLLSALTVNLDADGAVKDKLIEDFGGCVVNIEPGTYRIERDPFAYTIVIHGEQERPDLEGITEAATESLGRVFIDTRCLAMIDRELLDDSDVLSKYQQLWFAGEEKACRDLIRDNGGAVRYGFQRYGDELGIYRIPDTNTICLWPDVAEEAAGADAGSEMAAAAE